MYSPSSHHSSSALGHYYFMQDDLQNAYSAYQQALFLLPKPKVPYPFQTTHQHITCFIVSGISILYDWYGSLDHAKKLSASVLKANMTSCSPALSAFSETHLAPSPTNIWFQISHIYEQQE
ncbi:hypothetical protein EV363DRAFT_1175233 [Boletus edulis]|nr:hypothetical protein EV363DRAFT_1175233 [Boletus edulis]